MLKKWILTALGSLTISLLVTLWITPQIKNLRLANQPLKPSSIAESSEQPSQPESTFSEVPSSSQEEVFWQIGEYEGNVAVFYNGDPTPIQILDMPLSMLPKADRELLYEKILVRSEEELLAILEDYS